MRKSCADSPIGLVGSFEGGGADKTMAGAAGRLAQAEIIAQRQKARTGRIMRDAPCAKCGLHMNHERCAE
jgi:hypothetical protein